jgi:hypothetical protein
MLLFSFSRFLPLSISLSLSLSPSRFSLSSILYKFIGLMFLRTNNTSIAARLEVPETHFLLERVRPDLLLMRVVCKSLVLWDSISVCFVSLFCNLVIFLSFCALRFIFYSSTFVLDLLLYVSFVNSIFCILCPLFRKEGKERKGKEIDQHQLIRFLLCLFY